MFSVFCSSSKSGGWAGRCCTYTYRFKTYSTTCLPYMCTFFLTYQCMNVMLVWKRAANGIFPVGGSHRFPVNQTWERVDKCLVLIGCSKKELLQYVYDITCARINTYGCTHKSMCVTPRVQTPRLVAINRGVLQKTYKMNGCFLRIPHTKW